MRRVNVGDRRQGHANRIREGIRMRKDAISNHGDAVQMPQERPLDATDEASESSVK